MSKINYENFEAAYSKLDQFCNEFNKSEIQRAGLIQAFEFTFEQCWKALQKKAASAVSIASPKKAFEWAMAAGFISNQDEKIWLNMLEDRNLTSHTYRDAMAIQVSDNILNFYKAAFGRILTQMKANP